MPVEAAARGASVWIGWGEGVLGESLEAAGHHQRSAGALIRSSWGASAPQRAGAFWPGRTDQLIAPGSPLARALNDAPPVVWQGRIDGPVARDEVVWNGLRGVVRRWLDALPLEPPPDRSDATPHPR
jgi:hypothetical protein